jgi:hypothetical protein
MRCNSCGQVTQDGFSFCDNCGAKIVTQSPPVKAPSSLPSAPMPSKSEAYPRQNPLSSNVLAELQLTMWRPLRWLLANNYGTLRVTETHLEHETVKFWAIGLWGFLTKLFNWGFDIWSSLAISKGSTDLRMINHIRIFGLDWIVWKGHYLFIWSGGLPTIYVFSSQTLPQVEVFVESLKLANAQAKISVRKES